MNLTIEQQDNIISRNNKLEEIKPILKKEFIGLDNVIDQLISMVRPFYIFPQSLKRPLVINLFGMTATGKTHLVQRLVELLDMRNRYVRFDVGEYTGSDYKLRNELSNEIGRMKEKNIIIVFDEFQFGRTIDEQGAELKSTAMRPVWDLLDSGKILKLNARGFSEIYELMQLFEKCLEAGVEIDSNGIVTKNEKEYNMIFRSYYLKPIDFNKVDYAGLKISKEDEGYYSSSSYNSRSHNKHFKQPFFIKESFYEEALYEHNKEIFEFVEDISEARRKFFSNKTLSELVKWIRKQLMEARWIITEEDFSQSLIFCLGNIDEAYRMYDSSDPDADADLFYENSLKITVPKMKEALAHRFRMEQIGRLGNNHIIYPAFTRASYEKIIQKHLNIRIDYFKEEFNIDLIFKDSIADIIYKEGVFPSQGVRPLLSTFNTLIDSYISRIIADIILNYPNANSVTWSFDYVKEKYVFKVFERLIGELDESKIKSFEYEVKLQIDKLRKTDFSELQAFTAVHESGHAVISAVKCGLIPKEVVSKTASTAEGFCRIEFPDIDTRDLLYKHIMVLMGGIEAEKLFFGMDLVSNGAYSDLKRATETANKMVKMFGMAGKNYISHTHTLDTNEIMAIHDQGAIENEVKKIINKAQKEAKKCLLDNKLFVLDVADYLSNNSKMGRDTFRDIALNYMHSSEFRDKDHYYEFKDTIQRLKKAEQDKRNRFQKKILENQSDDIAKSRSIILNNKTEEDQKGKNKN